MNDDHEAPGQEASPQIQNPMMAWVRGGTRTTAGDRKIAEDFAASEHARAVADREHQLASTPIEQGGALMHRADLQGPAGATYVYVRYLDRSGTPYTDGIGDIMIDSDGAASVIITCPRCIRDRGLHLDQAQLTVSSKNKKFDFEPGPPKFKVFDDGFGPQRYRIAGRVRESEKFTCARCEWTARFSDGDIRED